MKLIHSCFPNEKMIKLLNKVLDISTKRVTLIENQLYI